MWRVADGARAISELIELSLEKSEPWKTSGSDTPNPVETDRRLGAEEISSADGPSLLGRYVRCIGISVEFTEVLGIWPGLNPADAFGCARNRVRGGGNL